MKYVIYLLYILKFTNFDKISNFILILFQNFIFLMFTYPTLIKAGVAIGAICLFAWLLHRKKSKKSEESGYKLLETDLIESVNVIKGRKEIRILTIDGGGIRGIIPTVILREIERKTKKPISSLFDLVAGTSIGGIISLSLTTPDKQGNPLISTDKMLSILVENGKDIFKSSFLDKIHNLGGMTDEKYDAEGLITILKTHLEDTPMSNTLIPVMVTSFELRRYIPYSFKSWDNLNDFHRWFAGRATSAAPTYFELADGKNLQGNPFSCIDGGVIMNNPSISAYAEAKKLYPGAHKVFMVSIGTGERPDVINPDEAKDWGLGGWIRPLIDIMMDGNSRATDHQMGEILPKDCYLRLQPILTPDLMPMDNVSAENIGNLVKNAENYVKINDEKMEKLCKFLLTARK